MTMEKQTHKTEIMVQREKDFDIMLECFINGLSPEETKEKVNYTLRSVRRYFTKFNSNETTRNLRKKAKAEKQSKPREPKKLRGDENMDAETKQNLLRECYEAGFSIEETSIRTGISAGHIGYYFDKYFKSTQSQVIRKEVKERKRFAKKHPKYFKDNEGQW